jgi:hypothetical protein
MVGLPNDAMELRPQPTVPNKRWIGRDNGCNMLNWRRIDACPEYSFLFQIVSGTLHPVQQALIDPHG